MLDHSKLPSIHVDLLWQKIAITLAEKFTNAGLLQLEFELIAPSPHASVDYSHPDALARDGQ